MWHGPIEKFVREDIYPWLRKITKKSVYCVLWANWHQHIQMPKGYDHYLISYHIENPDIKWIAQQQSRTGGRYIILHQGNDYGQSSNEIRYITYIEHHRDLEQMISWWGVKETSKDRKYKFSAVCNRITQSKVWITTKLLETARDQSLIVLGDWTEGKNVHYWETTGNPVLDSLTETFKTKYLGLKISDNFDQSHNDQRHNSNPWQPMYVDSILHFTNNSFHYSYMMEGDQTYTYPGPDIDEKTLKCLLSGTPFIPCGQFEILKTLSDLGLTFDYGFDLSWDLDPGNISRFESICRLIDDLNQIDPLTLAQKVLAVGKRNQDFILNKNFFTLCEKKNSQALEQIDFWLNHA